MKFVAGKIYIHMQFDEPYVLDSFFPGGVRGRLQTNGRWRKWSLEGAEPGHWLRPLAVGESKRRTILIPPPVEES